MTPSPAKGDPWFFKGLAVLAWAMLALVSVVIAGWLGPVLGPASPALVVIAVACAGATAVLPRSSWPGQVLVRLGVGGIAVALATVFVVATAMPYGGGGGTAMTFASGAAFFTTGWAALPVARRFRVAGALAAGAWVVLALFLATVGVGTASGWMLGPWFLATVALVTLLVLDPPAYLARARPGRPVRERADGPTDEVPTVPMALEPVDAGSEAAFPRLRLVAPCLAVLALVLLIPVAAGSFGLSAMTLVGGAFALGAAVLVVVELFTVPRAIGMLRSGRHRTVVNVACVVVASLGLLLCTLYLMQVVPTFLLLARGA